MTHDHTRISAVVDGEAGVDERDDVLAHVMGCDDCRAFYRQERAAKLALADRDATSTTTPVTLVAALLALAPGGATSSPGSTADLRQRPVASRPPGRPGHPHELPGQHRRRLRRAAKGLGLSVVGAGLLCALAFVLGADAQPRVASIDLASFGVEHAGVAAATADRGAGASVGTLAVGAVPAGFAITEPPRRTATDAGFTTTAAQNVGGVTSSTYRKGAQVVSVFRVDGRVDPAALPGFSTHRLDGARLLRRVGTPSYQVWTCHDVTYSVVGDSTEAIDEVSRQLPHVCPARSGWSRVGQGMHRAAGWLSPIS